MKEYAKAFYKGKQWKKISRLYMEQQHYICERCGGVATICHHRKYISPANINNPAITLNFDNLEALCVKESAELEEYKKAIEELERMKKGRV